MTTLGRILCRSAQGFFGRVDDLSDPELFNKVVRMRKKEVVDEISLITAKLNIGYEEARSFDIETRHMYIERVQEMFGDKKQQHENGPMSTKEKELAAPRFDSPSLRMQRNLRQ